LVIQLSRLSRRLFLLKLRRSNSKSGTDTEAEPGKK
jgi:hypothetical protein